MSTSLTKAEIIAKLQELPDLPVIYALGCETLMSSHVSKVEVVTAVKGSFYDDDGEYEKVPKDADAEYIMHIYGRNKTIEAVIWIS